MSEPPESEARSILITGGTGFLGSHLLRRLARGPAELIILKRSFSDTWRIAALADRLRFYDIDRAPLRAAFENHDVDVVVHCATNYGRASMAPTTVVEANLTLPLTLLQLATEYRVPAFVNTDTALDRRISHYSLAKHQFLEWLVEYAPRLACVNVTLEHFYGPRDDPTKFVTWVVRSLLAGVPHLDLTPGEQRRDFVFIDDVVSAFEALIPFARSCGPGLHQFEMGSGTSVSIREFVETAKRVCGNNTTDLRFGALPYRVREVMESRADLTRLRALGWEPTVPLSDGLSRTMISDRAHTTTCAT
jgi:nucleoside-diphosphate-sugar epimerase